MCVCDWLHGSSVVTSLCANSRGVRLLVLAGLLEQRNIAKGREVFKQGDSVNGLCILMQGKCKVCCVQPDLRQRCISLTHSGSHHS